MNRRSRLEGRAGFGSPSRHPTNTAHFKKAGFENPPEDGGPSACRCGKGPQESRWQSVGASDQPLLDALPVGSLWSFAPGESRPTARRRRSTPQDRRRCSTGTRALREAMEPEVLSWDDRGQQPLPPSPARAPGSTPRQPLQRRAEKVPIADDDQPSQQPRRPPAALGAAHPRHAVWKLGKNVSELAKRVHPVLFKRTTTRPDRGLQRLPPSAAAPSRGPSDRRAMEVRCCRRKRSSATRAGGRPKPSDAVPRIDDNYVMATWSPRWQACAKRAMEWAQDQSPARSRVSSKSDKRGRRTTRPRGGPVRPAPAVSEALRHGGSRSTSSATASPAALVLLTCLVATRSGGRSTSASRLLGWARPPVLGLANYREIPATRPFARRSRTRSSSPASADAQTVLGVWLAVLSRATSASSGAARRRAAAWVMPTALSTLGWWWMFDSLYSVVNWTGAIRLEHHERAGSELARPVEHAMAAVIVVNIGRGPIIVPPSHHRRWR